MNEWTFTSSVSSWINEILARNPHLPFSAAKCEQFGKGTTRRDLTLYNKDEQIVLTGEVKLPHQKDGGTPYNANLKKDAFSKARQAKVDFYFTWNVNEFVLWETAPLKTTWQEQKYKSWNVTNVHQESHIGLPMTEHAIKAWLAQFLNEFSQILQGIIQIGYKSPDEIFIDALESALKMPITFSYEELERRYNKNGFKRDLDKWMREEQGWTISDDPEGRRDNLERAAKLACYLLVNKLVFHEALLKRYRVKMGKLDVPAHIDTADRLRIQLESYFENAKKITGDYEPVFGEEHSSIGNRIPFYSDKAVSHWRDLIARIHEFDFSKLDYEVIGSIFERLISPEERHKYGQYYTRVEVVDLINSFCITKGDEKVMDPACGGGTFLVRAYIRKREIKPDRKHNELLSDLYGIDIANFAANLTIINLASRDLVEYENYPRVQRNDFFNILSSDKMFISLPDHSGVKSTDKDIKRNIAIPLLDAVIGNPPYIEQGKIPKNNDGENGCKHGTKEYYNNLVKCESGAELSGRSDIHCYFWPHAMSFIKDNGYICFITSSQWLDVEYGFNLQKWILNNFEIVALIESIEEPWFIGARVATTVAILKRQLDKKIRMGNMVRFIQVRRPISEILVHDGTTIGAITASDKFRNEILSLKENTENERYRARLVSQEQLWDEGVKLGAVMSEYKDFEDEETHGIDKGYYGGKWGIHLRAPDLWFKFIDILGNNLTPLCNVAKIRRGITSGKDIFFFPKDCTEECLKSANEHLDIGSISLKEVESGKVKLVRCGEGYGEIQPIESKYIEPEVHSLMEVDGFVVESKNCSRHALLVGKQRDRLTDKYVQKYIEWGEKRGWDLIKTCASRVSENKEWYDLTGHDRAPILWPKARQYRHIAVMNPHRFVANCGIYEIYPHSEFENDDLFGGILNSTWVLLSSFQYGRPVGNEGHMSTMVSEVNMMLVPDPRKASEKQSKRVIDAFVKLKERKPLQFLSERRMREMAYRQSGKEDKLLDLSDESELDLPDRKELDDAVLELLGIGSKKQREQLNKELYSCLHEYFESIRQKEEKAIVNKKKSKRRTTVRPNDIAFQIFQEIKENRTDLLKSYHFDFIDSSKPFDAYEIPAEGTPQHYTDMFIPIGVVFISKRRKKLEPFKVRNHSQAELLIFVAESGVRGIVRFPFEEKECRRVYKNYTDFIKKREDEIREMIELRTADEAIQDKIYSALLPLIINAI
jgi:hypothetical protein